MLMEQAPGTMLSFMVLIVAVILATTTVFLCWLIGWHPVQWWRKYYRNNVRGHIARFWIEKGEDDKYDWTCDVIAFKGQRTRRHYLAIEIPLGGWFRRARIVPSFFGVATRYSKHWFVQLHTVNWDTNTILIKVSYRNPSRSRNEHVVLELTRAIQVLATITSGDNTAFDLDSLVTLAMVKQEALEEDRAEVARALEAVRDERDGLVIELGVLNAMIARTHRCKTHVETLRVWERLLDVLIKAHKPGSGFSQDDEMHQALISGRARVRAALEEKSKRSRRRGTKKPAVATSS